MARAPRHRRPRAGPLINEQEECHANLRDPRADNSVEVALGVGAIRIEAGDRPDTTVDVLPSDPNKKADVTAAEQTSIEYADGHLLVKAPSGWRQWMPRRGSESIDVSIALPEGSRVRVDAGVAALHGHGRLGECHCRVGVGDIVLGDTGPVNLKTGAGQIALGHVDGKAETVTGIGTVRIGSVDGTATVKNSSGETSGIGEVMGEARLNAADGSITVDRAGAGIVAKTARGDVRIGEVARAAVDAQTAFGHVDVGVLDGVAAWLDLRTKFGAVRNDLDVTERPAAGQDTVEVHVLDVVRRHHDSPVVRHRRQEGCLVTRSATGTSALEVVGLRKSFGDTVALDGVDLPRRNRFGLRLARAERRRRQDHDRAHPDDADRSRLRERLRVAGHDAAQEPNAVRDVIGVTGQFSAVDTLLTGRRTWRSWRTCVTSNGQRANGGSPNCSTGSASSRRLGKPAAHLLRRHAVAASVSR